MDLSDRPAVSAEHFSWVLGVLCQIHRLPFDAALLLQQFPPPHQRHNLIEAARALAFKAGEVAIPEGQAPTPFIAFLKARPEIPALVLKRDGERFLYLEAGSEVPSARPASDFHELFDAHVVLVSHAAPEDLPFEASPRRFGFGWFVPELARHRAIWRDVLLASLALQVIGLATPLFTQVIIDKVVVHHTQSTLLAVGVALGMFLIFNALMTGMRQYLIIHTGNRVDAVLATAVFRHLFRLPLPYFERRPTGVTVARMHGVETIREFITGAAIAFVLDLPFLAIILAVMFWYSWQLSLIALGVMLLLAAISAVVTPLWREKLNRQFMLGARNQAFMTEYVAGAETVKTLQFEPVLERRFGDYLAGYLAAGFTTRQLANLYHVASSALEQLMTIAILLVGALLVMRNDGFTIGMLVAFQMFAARMAQPMLRIAGLWQEFQQANIAVRRLGDIMDAPAEPYTLTPSRADGPGRIDLQGVAFRYSEKHPYLYRNLSHRVRPGTLLVVSGPSGCGKSTLAKLLLGFYRPTDGRIQLDGRDLSHLSANELRQSFGVVPQETVLFSGSIHDNLTMANPHASFAAVVTACKLAEIHETIEKLPEGYQTPLGEHGIGLSGGQKQRLAIARALLKRPKLLIFDEATSNLDQLTAEQLAQTINRLKGAATIIFIAHAIPRGLQVDEQLRFGPRPAPSREKELA
ncbi:MAG TPA: peptidase domain-containing ABC transporter [Burkholderiales bacterium]|nr:peptidase domain-containing ABC transporter [Burkholderiales bacterium]